MSIKQFAKKILPSSMWTQLRLLKQKQHLIRFKEYRVSKDCGGHQLTITIGDAMAQSWYDHDLPRLAEIELLSKYNLKKGARVFDFGAHQGVVAMMLAKEVAPGNVFALEANTHNFKMAMKNKQYNNVQNLEIIHMAVSEKTGEIAFNKSLNGSIDDGNGEWGQAIIPSISIDDMTTTYGKPDVIYIDIEGYEGKVLRGAMQTFNHNPSWFIEMHGKEAIEKFGGSIQEILDHFIKRNYQLFYTEQESPLQANYSPLPPDKVPTQRFFMVAIPPQNTV